MNATNDPASSSDTIHCDAFFEYYLECKSKNCLTEGARKAGMIYEQKIKGMDLLRYLKDPDVRTCLQYFTWTKQFQNWLLLQCAEAADVFEQSFKNIERIEGPA